MQIIAHADILSFCCVFGLSVYFPGHSLLSVLLRSVALSPIYPSHGEPGQPDVQLFV